MGLLKLGGRCSEDSHERMPSQARSVLGQRAAIQGVSSGAVLDLDTELQTKSIFMEVHNVWVEGDSELLRVAQK
jgi:hypothetical protein